MKTGVVVVTAPLILCSLLVYLCNGQDCTSPVYSNSGITIRGPCPSSQVIAPVGNTIKFECSYSHTGTYLSFWNITDIVPIVSSNVPSNSSIDVTINGGNNGFTMLTLPVTKQDSLHIQCGLCNAAENKCFNSLQPTVMSLPIQLISFGK